MGEKEVNENVDATGNFGEQNVNENTKKDINENTNVLAKLDENTQKLADVLNCVQDKDGEFANELRKLVAKFQQNPNVDKFEFPEFNDGQSTILLDCMIEQLELNDEQLNLIKEIKQKMLI